VKSAAYKMLNKILGNFGAILIPVREAKDRSHLENNYRLRKDDILRINESLNGGLRQHLVENGKRRWLEIGCGGKLEDDFHYIDIYPESIVDRSARKRYSRLDIVNASAQDLEQVGRFDLVRMQHVFEHFTPEDGSRVLENVGSLLNAGGLLLITTPDLRIHAMTYLNGGYKDNVRMEPYNSYARMRIPENAPNSYYFSVFAHSLLYEKHLWCYDFEGLRYQLSCTGLFEDIQQIGLDHPFASCPFTHNRPEHDVCVLARRK
jgi:predicted SAM-dependent methyltransferase